MTGYSAAGAQAFNPGVAFNGAPGGGLQIFIPMQGLVFQSLTDEAYDRLRDEVLTLVGSTLDDLREREPAREEN